VFGKKATLKWGGGVSPGDKKVGDVMDGELWAAMRMSNSKRHHNLQPSYSVHLDQLINLDDVDGDEDMRPEFSCPYCDEDFDITSLCSHLENEHCFESKPAVS
jgi:hypothetical protein